MRQRMWVWVGIGMFVVTMLISGVVLQGGGHGSLSLGQGQLLADGGDNPGPGDKCHGKNC